jgi:prepilin-type N-terminal cleavage/methylation domain-containing protein
MSAHTRGDDGFTLAEVLTAMSIIAIALLAMTAALHYGLSGIEIGRGESVAAFLVEDKLEELKAVALVDWADGLLEPGTTTEYCQPSTGACSPTPAPTAFRRTTTVAAGGGATCTAQCKFVMVSVFYRPVTALGQLDEERRVDVGAIFVARA